ncbi:hypothetical protein FACS1894202_00130 [Clostridia bacterium]|nr:hypothetical protein FACS1894202_00130 [Clostridia bacterium]
MTFSIIGNDARQERLTRLLLRDGHTVHASPDPRSDCVVWGIPTPSNAAEFIRAGQIAIGGRVPSGLDVIDYVKREDFAIANAVPSAEGAIQLAMERTERTIHGSDALVIGFGRIGKVLSRSLAALGARVTVSARKTEDFKWCQTLNYGCLETSKLEGRLGAFDSVFNTVPKPVLTDGLLSELREDALVLDLASAPGGVDFAAAKNRGVNCHWALGLPAKVAPETAATILRDTVYAIIRERLDN